MQTPSAPPPYLPPVPDPEALAQLRAALLDEPARMDAVGAMPRPEAVDALIALAAELNPPLDAEQVRQASQNDPLGLDAFDPQPVTGTVPPGPRWLPLGLGSDGAQITVKWGHYGAGPLDAPFFADHLRRARSHPLTVLMRWWTPLASLIEQFSARPPRLDGLVFHMSRCGSTLVNQTLAALPGTIALSEPAPLDEVVQLCQSRADLDPQLKVALLRAMVAALTVDREGQAARRFIKTDCWHAGALPLFRAAFPETPWIFLYRDAVEVLLSHEAMPGAQTFPGPHAALVGVDEPGAIPGIGFSARVLAATCQAAADHAGIGGGLLVDYADLPGALWERILPHFGIAPTEGDRAQIEQALGRDAKRPGQSFDPNERPGREQASAEVLAAAAQLEPVVQRLRALAGAAAD